MTTILLTNLAPTVLIAGAALGYTARRFRAIRKRNRTMEVPLGRVAFATNLVQTRRRRSR